MHLTTRIHHYAVAVSDLQAAVEWYCEKLDFFVHKQFTIPEAKIEIVKLVTDSGVQIELLKHNAENPPPRAHLDLVAPGTRHICFEVDNIEEAAEEIRRRAIPLTQEPKVFEASREKNCWIEDIEGNPIEFIEEMGDAW